MHGTLRVFLSFFSVFHSFTKLTQISVIVVRHLLSTPTPQFFKPTPVDLVCGCLRHFIERFRRESAVREKSNFSTCIESWRTARVCEIALVLYFRLLARLYTCNSCCNLSEWSWIIIKGCADVGSQRAASWDIMNSNRIHHMCLDIALRSKVHLRKLQRQFWK